MRNHRLWPLIVSICLIQTPEAAEPPVYTTVLLQGNAPVAIDGDLSDWSTIQIPSRPLTTWMKVRNWLIEDPFLKENFQGPEDLAARFRAFADQNDLYIAVEVTDDRLVFDDSGTFGRGSHDDMVQIYLDGDLAVKHTEVLIPIRSDYDANDAVIDITRGQDGRTVVAGSLPGLSDPVPYLWEAVGVEAAFRAQEGGYTVEVRIPGEVLGIKAFGIGTKIGLNVAVTDDDDGAERDNKLGWSGDTENLGHKTTVNIGRLLLGSQKTLPQAPAAKSPASGDVPPRFMAEVRQGEGNRLIVTLTDQERVGQQIQIHEARNIESVRQHLAAIKSQAPTSRHVIGSAGLLASLARQAGDYDEAMRALDEIRRVAREPGVRNWQAIQRVKLRSSQARHLERTSELDRAIALWQEARQGAADFLNQVQDKTMVVHSANRMLIDALDALIRLYDQQGDRQAADRIRREAIALFDKITAQYPVSYIGRIANRRRLRYRLHFGEDALAQQEVEAYLQAVSDYPKYVTLALVQAANNCRMKRRYAKALAYYQRALDLAGGEGTVAMEAYHESGLTYCAMGQWQKAIERFETVLAKDSKSLPWGTVRIPAAHYYMARALRRLGHNEEALHYYQIVVKDYPPSPIYKKARRSLDVLLCRIKGYKKFRILSNN